jgi:hypothetical protein
MRKSDVFEDFVKIAQEKGLVSEDAPEKAKKKLEKNPRWDSTTAEEISKLYGVKPEAPKSMQYEKNIAEVAHQKPVVVSPAYDKLNGLVENINERQNILLHIVNKTPDGLSTQKKYAEQDLILALVRLGNDLDNRNHDGLRALADACLTQVSSKVMKKVAVAPLVYIVPALIGSLYVQQHMPFVNEGLEKNHQKLIAELDDLLESNSNFGVGYQYKPEFVAMVSDFKNKLMSFYNLYKKVEPVISSLEKPRTAKELVELSQQPEADSVVKSYNALKAAAANILPVILTVAKDFASENYKNRQIEEKGFFSSLVDKTQVLHGGKGLVGDDFDDVARAIPPYLKSIQELSTLLAGAGSLQQKAQADLQEAAYKSEDLLGNKPVAEESKVVPANVKSLDDEADELEKELSQGLLT